MFGTASGFSVRNKVEVIPSAPHNLFHGPSTQGGTYWSKQQQKPWKGHSGCDPNSSQLSEFVLVVYLPLKNMKVSWDGYSLYIYIYIYRKKQVPNHQPVLFFVPSFMLRNKCCPKFQDTSSPDGPIKFHQAFVGGRDQFHHFNKRWVSIPMD